MTATDEPDDLLEAAFADAFQLLEEQTGDDIVQVVMRMRFTPYARDMSPEEYVRLAKVVLCDCFREKKKSTARSLASLLKIPMREIERLRRTSGYKKMREETIGIREHLASPKLWKEHIQDPIVQDRAFKRQNRMALTSGNLGAVNKALESMAERAAPAMKNQQPVVQISISQDEIERYDETRRMLQRHEQRVIEGEVLEVASD